MPDSYSDKFKSMGSSMKSSAQGMGSSMKSSAQGMGSSMKSSAQGMGSSMKKGMSSAKNKLTRKNLRKTKINTLEKIVGRLNKDQFRKLTRSLISLSGGNPDLPQWDEFEPWPSAELQQKKSITRMLDEEMNWMKPCAEKPCKPEELVQTKNDASGQPMDAPRGAKIAEKIAYKSTYAQPCKYECTNIESDGQCAPDGYTDTIGCGDWNSALKGAKIMKYDPETIAERKAQKKKIKGKSEAEIERETEGITPSELGESGVEMKETGDKADPSDVYSADRFESAGGRRTRRHKKHSKTKRARKHRKGGKSKVKRHRRR